MPSDIARRSYDVRQHYRSVVAQQGRVTLEADWNEAMVIAAEEQRREALDIVGPVGTPDNGYLITPGPGFDFSIGHGTMYVGGERLFLVNPAATTPPGQELLYSQQNQPMAASDPPRSVEWLDAAIDPDFVPVPTTAPSREFIYLKVREQEVGAVEDSDLKDVALGGPDTAQRTRLIQHVVRRSGETCGAGLRLARAEWAKEGLAFDPATMRLLSEGRLQVGLTSQAPPPDPCRPAAQGGYLGADNQLIRIQISGIGQLPAARGPAAAVIHQLLWGYDDASFLYRVDVLNSTTLHLQTAPVDANHQPRAAQAIEILMPAAQLANREFIAAPGGFVTTVATAYNPDTQTLTLTKPLPLVYGDGTTANPSPPRVFLRVWEEQLPFTPGVPVPLNATGLEVTLTLAAGTEFHLGDFWMFAVRPATPQQVYPERLLAAPQPPDGPRLWVCPLGVIAWSALAPGGTLQEDCRHFFSPLTKLVFAEANGGPPVGPRQTLNFIGAGITVADNPAAARIDITIPTGGGGAVEASPTALLFPFVTNQAGFDTGIVVSNTTADPFGTTPQTGKITFNYYGTGGLGVPDVEGPISGGQQFEFLLSTKAPGFQGYIIAVCEFAGAYGFALITDKTQGTSSGYLPIVLPKRPISG